MTEITRDAIGVLGGGDQRRLGGATLTIMRRKTVLDEAEIVLGETTAHVH